MGGDVFHWPWGTEKRKKNPKHIEGQVKRASKMKASKFNKTKVNISSTRQALQELSANGYKLTGGSRSEWDMELLKPLQNIDEGKTFSSSSRNRRRSRKNKRVVILIRKAWAGESGGETSGQGPTGEGPCPPPPAAPRALLVQRH